MKRSDQEAEAALPPRVAKGLHLGFTPEEQQLQAGGVGPGGQTGPDPNTRRFQEGGTYAREDGPGYEGPISGSPATASPTRAQGDGGAAASSAERQPQSTKGS